MSGRRPRGRRKVRFEEILPSTDLPPLVQGDLRCFLVVDIGKIVWSSTATAQVPPASPAYIRLRWWGETSDGTLFKPSSAKAVEKPVKCRCRFGVRSGAKQMSAYFVDMGSIVFEVLTSPKSVPLGRIQIPKVAHLSSSNPIRDFFPIYSPSSRKIGELEIHIRFKSLEGAYDLSTDTGTDTSMSSRSRPPSEVGRRSRSRGSSVGSNRGSTRSRSSSNGSRKSGRRKRSGSRSSKGRRRSCSTESNASSASKRSHSIKKGTASTVNSSTPRGIDDLLQQNGHDLYEMEKRPPQSSNTKSAVKEKEAENLRGPSSLQQDAISVLLQRGNQLREDILKSQFDTNEPKAPNVPQQSTIPSPKKHMEVISKEGADNGSIGVNMKPSAPQPFLPKMVTPIKERRQDLDVRFVDLVFGSQEFKGQSALFSGFDSHSVSPLSSMISEFEDNPLYDESLLQQMFYSNGAMMSMHRQDSERVNNEQLKVLEGYKRQEKTSNRIPGMSDERLLCLQTVNSIAVTVETLALNQTLDFSVSKPKRKGRGRGGKPPMPSPMGKQKSGTYFVEYRFPDASESQREHPSSMTTSHDVTRVVSRRGASADNGIVFDECYEYQFHFTEANLRKWINDDLDFSIHCRRPNEKRAHNIGVASVSLKEMLTSDETEFLFDLDVMENQKVVGILKVSVVLISPPLQPSTSEMESPEHVTEERNAQNDKIPDEQGVTKNSDDIINSESNIPSIALSPSTSVLYMMTMVQEGVNIPGATVISQTQGIKSLPPNVSLVCRTLTSGECDKTPTVWGQFNPKFDFVQISPLKIDNTLISRMRNNFIIIEVWTKITSTEPHSDKLLGLAKLPTQYFYESLKDEEISRVVLNSMHPLISVDEAVSIIDVFTGQERGQLQVTLALGTQSQISNLRKVKSKIQGKRAKQHNLEDEKSTKSDQKVSGPVMHTFEVNIMKLNGFKPKGNQMWGETDCFVQYQFPTQKSQNAEESLEQSDSAENLNLATPQSYRTDATLCIPDPAFNDVRKHTFSPPPSVPVQRILLSCCYSDGMPGGIPFELWSRYYHPNVRDQVLAKGTLPIAKLGALVTMTNKKASEQTFHIPMEFVDPEHSNDPSAGNLEIHVKYKSSGMTLESMQPTMKFSKPVILRVALLRACGLKAAASLACRHSNDNDLKYSAEAGVNTYVQLKPTFLPEEDSRVTRIVAQNFSPEYQHTIEIPCPLVSYHRDITPVSLAELLLSGKMEISIWHKPEDDSTSDSDGVLLANLTIPMRPLLHKTTGLNMWYPLKAPESRRSSREESTIVGGMEVSMSFTCQNDLDLILKSAKATGWSLPPFESKILNDDIIHSDITGTDRVTFSVTVTNAWLPKNEVLLHGRTNIDKNANVYVRYKFFDHDSVTSSLCPLASKQPHSIDARFENLTSARIAHKKSFGCKRSHPLNWYLREENFEIQVWLTHSTGSRKSRPLDSDKLLGSCCLNVSTISDLDKEQHISGSFNLFKAGMDDLSHAQIRVYLSMKPGDVADPIPDPVPEVVASEEERSSQKMENDECEAVVEESKPNPEAFSAVVTVERAMHLPLVGDLETDKLGPPNIFTSYDVVEDAQQTESRLKMVTMATKITMTTENPIWNDVEEVALPRHLLSGTQGGLLFKVWHRDRLYMTEPDQQDKSNLARSTELLATDRMLGFATLDLSVLRAGLRDVNGWYNILDIHGQCQGQLKVAVTPTQSLDLSQPNTARSGLSLTKVSQTSSQNFLLAAPVDIPVRTPSGSMYFPGIQNSTQTVPSTCKMSETEENEFLRRSTDNPRKKFSDDFSAGLNLPTAPSSSMFRYATSDRQQACLVNTLQKQIEELEHIKRKFEQRRAAGFKEQSTGGKVQSDSRATHQEKCHSTSTSEGSICKGQDFLRATETTKELPAVPQSEICIEDDRTFIPHITNPNTVHLSLYNPPKKPELEDRALSDNELTSDLEFVQPKSLNESPRSDFSNETYEVLDPLHKKLPHADLKYSKPPEPSPFTPVMTPARSEGPSVLEDTSLWLTGSTLRVSGVTSDDEEVGEILEVQDEGLLQHPAEDEIKTPTPDERIMSPLQEITQEEEDAGSGVDDSHLNGGGPEVDSSDRESQCTPVTDVVDSPVPPDPQEAEQQDSSSLLRESQHSDTESEHDKDSELEGSKLLEEESEETAELKNNEKLSLASEEQITVNEAEIPELEVTHNLSPDNSEDHERENTVSIQNYPTRAPRPPRIPLTFNPPSHVKNLHRNDENRCPNLSSPPTSSLQQREAGFSSFYPPVHNLEASVRALQEATMKYQHDIRKKKLTLESSPEPRSQGPKTKKIPPKPTDYSDERTQRLARIFRTKFS